MRKARVAAAALGLALAGLTPHAAHAGTFNVYGLGLNGAGCPNGWQAQTFSPNKFRQGNFCSRWEIQSTRDGTPLKQGEFAGASLFAGEGARFTGFAIRSTGTTRNGVIWKMAMCATAFTNCKGHFPQQGSWWGVEFRLGSLASAGSSPIYARHLWAGVSCEQSTCADSDSAGRAAQITHTESHAVVDDYTAPAAPSLSGVSTGWNSGQKQLAYRVSDAGSGVESVTLTIDGSLHRTIRHSCTRLPGGGYTQPVPCLTSTASAFTVNQPGQLADGRHTLSVTSRDAGGAAAARSQEFWVDNNAPTAPLELAVTGGDGWRNRNDFSLTWRNPHQGTGAPIVAAYYKIGSAPTSPTDGVRVAGKGITRLDGLQVPRDGDWTVHVWLQDDAGNADPGRISTAKLRLDTTAPALAFSTERDPHNPAEVRVDGSDAGSGVAGGQIHIRPRGVAHWQPLETRREGADLVATIPDERLERGTYELQATAWDAVGNRAATTRRSDGREMLVDLPLRGETSVSAGVADRAGDAARSRTEMRLAYGKEAWLRGVLRTGDTPLAHTRLRVLTRAIGGPQWAPLAEVLTDGAGRYAVRLPRGGSRELRVEFAGSRSLRPAADEARLLVRGWASLRLTPRRLRRGGTITFRGRVGRLGAAIPAAGKLIQIQYLDGRRWRPAVKLGRTDRRGTFAIRYRFRRISRPTRILFRILVPSESGWPYLTGASRVRIARVRP